MKKSGIAIGIGALLVLVGLIVFVGALHLGEETKSFDITAGSLNYNYLEVGLFSGAQLSGRYTVDGGSSINLYIFDKTEYDHYVNGGSAGYIAHSSGSTGTFDVTVDTGGTYYIVLEHGSGYEGIRQTGSVTHKITGTDVTMLAIGAVLLVIGLLLVVYGVMQRRKEAAEMAQVMTPAPSGVTYFEEPIGPTGPSQTEGPTSKPPQIPP